MKKNGHLLGRRGTNIQTWKPLTPVGVVLYQELFSKQLRSTPPQVTFFQNKRGSDAWHYWPVNKQEYPCTNMDKSWSALVFFFCLFFFLLFNDFTIFLIILSVSFTSFIFFVCYVCSWHISGARVFCILYPYVFYSLSVLFSFNSAFFYRTLCPLTDF